MGGREDLGTRKGRSYEIKKSIFSWLLTSHITSHITVGGEMEEAYD